MASRVIFSIYIDIPDDKLDNPGWYDRHGNMINTKKSKQTKDALKRYKDLIESNHRQYADRIGVDYRLVDDQNDLWRMLGALMINHPQISQYDIINFYKHFLMRMYANYFDEVCYVDYDVVFNTDESIFEAHDLTKFACAHSNDEARRGKRTDFRDYNYCIRSPSSKYWNTHALLQDLGYPLAECDTDVFNTGIMLASADTIKQLDYFGDFEELLGDMYYLKNESEGSMYHPNVRRSFGYDNETVFAYKRVINNIDIDYITEEWHSTMNDVKPTNKKAKVYHVINKRFEYLDHVWNSTEGASP